MARRRSRAAPQVLGLPTWTIDLVQRALAPDPESRFANGGELLEALRAAGVGRETSTTSVRRRSRPLRIAGVTTGLLLAVGTVVWWQGRDAADRASPTGAAGSAAPHVLWVDDDPANNRFIIERFTAHGVRVTTVLNTEEALQRFDPVIYHFVISDMGRYEGPGGAYVPRAGLQLLQALRARYPALELAFCTSARAVAEYREEALAAGARAIVTECEVILTLLGVEPNAPA